MKFKVKEMKISSGGPLIAITNIYDANKLDLHALERIKIKKGRKFQIALVDVADNKKTIKPGQIGLFKEVLESLKIKQGQNVEISVEPKPESLDYIKKKLDGERLSKLEINQIIKDIIDNRLTEIEITYFVSGVYINGLSMYENSYLTEAIANNGKKLTFKKYPILDKHCLAADVPVMVKNSQKTKVENISEIIDKFMENSKRDVIKSDGCEYLEKNLNNLSVLTFDDEGKVKYQKVEGIFRAKAPKKIYKIITIGNREIKATSDHTIFVLKDGKIINIPIKEIKEGDFVIVPSGIENTFEINKLDIKDEYKIRNYLKLDKEIKITPEFVRLLAYYIAEGFTNYQGIFLNFGSHEKELIEDSIKCIKKVFNKEPTVYKPHKTTVRVCLYNKVISKIFSEQINAGNRSLEKDIPYFIFDLNKDLQLEFVRTLIKGDGHIRVHNTIYITSSKKLATKLQYLLSNLGISTTLSTRKAGIGKFPAGYYKRQESYAIITQTKELFEKRKKGYNNSFLNLIPISEIGEIEKEKIGWEKRRELKRQKFMSKNKLSTFINYIKSEDIKKIIKGQISVLKVKQKSEIDYNHKYVYDFKVPKYSRFMAGTAPMCVHNCVSGVPGNRTTMIIVPIIASAGYYIPKTSTRSITSASGTSDTMEVLAPVAHSRNKIMEIVRKTHGCMVWGGALEIASADDKLIKIEKVLSLDPEGILLSSILAKKYAAGASHLIIDIPYGKGSKIEEKKIAKRLKRNFKHLGKLLGMEIKIILTEGRQPIGNGIGPALEARDVLLVLQNRGPLDLKEKSVKMAAMLLEMVGEKNPNKKALDILESGQAYKKMMEIIKEQGGNSNITPEKIQVGRFKHEVKAKVKGIVKEISNKDLVKIAKAAGAPKDKGAGIYLQIKLNYKIKKNQVLYTIYAETKNKLEEAIKINNNLRVINIDGELIKTFK